MGKKVKKARITGRSTRAFEEEKFLALVRTPKGTALEK